MQKNIGIADRTVRVILALVAGILIATGQLTGMTAIILGIVGAVLLATSVVSVCPLYSALKISTTKKQG
jgi:hypothetical protein